MSIWTKCLIALAVAVLGGQAAAQTATETEGNAEVRKAAEASKVDTDMREAEKRLEEAAQRIAELSATQLARVGQFQQSWVIDSDRPMIGIAIGDDDEDDEINRGPVAGVNVIGVTPGGAADEAGIRSGDTITSVNGESLSADNVSEANRKLLDFMQGVEEGDALDVEYLRDGKAANVEVRPKAGAARFFDFNFGGGNMNAANAPNAPQAFAYRWVEKRGGHGFGDMEMVELNKNLGRYFGTESGLLVVKAPEGNAFNLQDGDVIKSIDGREPKDLMHAIRILGSYEGGETVSIEIMRDKKKQTVKVDLPVSDRHSFVAPRPPRAVAPGPAASVVIVPRTRPAPVSEERT